MLSELSYTTCTCKNICTLNAQCHNDYLIWLYILTGVDYNVCAAHKINYNTPLFNNSLEWMSEDEGILVLLGVVLVDLVDTETLLGSTPPLAMNSFAEEEWDPVMCVCVCVCVCPEAIHLHTLHPYMYINSLLA